MGDYCLTPSQLYHGENKLYLDEDDDDFCFIL